MEPVRTAGGEVDTLSKVFVVSDDQECRESLVAMLLAFHFSVGSFETPTAFFESYHKSWPGCLLLELSSQGEGEEAFLEALRERGWEIPVVILAHTMEIRSVVRAMQLGALHLAETPCDPQTLRTWVEHGINLDAQRRSKQAQRETICEQLESLTEDEQQVLEGILAGSHNKEIAARLDIGVRTVQARRAAIMRKLDCQSVAKLVWKVAAAKLSDADEMIWKEGGAGLGDDESVIPNQAYKKSG